MGLRLLRNSPKRSKLGIVQVYNRAHNISRDSTYRSYGLQRGNFYDVMRTTDEGLRPLDLGSSRSSGKI